MYAKATKTERGDAMAYNDNGKRKGGGKTFWDIIANYSLVWWGLIMGGIIFAVVLEELSYK